MLTMACTRFHKVRRAASEFASQGTVFYLQVHRCPEAGMVERLGPCLADPQGEASATPASMREA